MTGLPTIGLVLASIGVACCRFDVPPPPMPLTHAANARSARTCAWNVEHDEELSDVVMQVTFRHPGGPNVSCPRIGLRRPFPDEPDSCEWIVPGPEFDSPSCMLYVEHVWEHEIAMTVLVDWTSTAGMTSRVEGALRLTPCQDSTYPLEGGDEVTVRFEHCVEPPNSALQQSGAPAATRPTK